MQQPYLFRVHPPRRYKDTGSYTVEQVAIRESTSPHTIREKWFAVGCPHFQIHGTRGHRIPKKQFREWKDAQIKVSGN